MTCHGYNNTWNPEMRIQVTRPTFNKASSWFWWTRKFETHWTIANLWWIGIKKRWRKGKKVGQRICKICTTLGGKLFYFLLLCRPKWNDLSPLIGLFCISKMALPFNRSPFFQFLLSQFQMAARDILKSSPRTVLRLKSFRGHRGLLNKSQAP